MNPQTKSYAKWEALKVWCKQNPYKKAAIVTPDGTFEITFKPMVTEQWNGRAIDWFEEIPELHFVDNFRRKLMPKYDIDEKTALYIENTFTYHRPVDDQPERYELLRNAAKNFAILICENSPLTAERTLALRKLEECVMYVNKNIACNE